MGVRVPRNEDLRRIAERRGIRPSEDELAVYQGVMSALLETYPQVERLGEGTPAVRYPRTSGYRPEPEDNPLNAWYWRCEIRGSGDGLLAGRTVAIKDNTSVAGVPMMNGSRTLEGFVPEFDATVVRRILDEGGEIAGKAACEDLCFSGGSHTCATGPIRNPWDPQRTSGGSSGGSAALVAAGEVDLALGGDQGGSIRIPSAWCGAVGHKPTYGLVPYTGAFPIELTLDHLGPIGRNVADVAAMLEAIAGNDGLDPRQPQDVPLEPYSTSVNEPIDDLRVAIVSEGFGWPDLSQDDVDAAVRDAAQLLDKAGATVTEISVPMHRLGLAIWNTIAVEGATALMMNGYGFGTNWEGFYARSMQEAYARGLSTRADDLSHTVKLTWMLGDYLHEHYQGRYYAIGQNVARKLRRAYDTALEEADILVMPTLPMTAPEIPAADAPIDEYLTRALEMIPNTAPFDVSGHPALTLPCAQLEGLPVGMMLVGRHFEDGRVLQAARLFEEQVGGFASLLGTPPS